jgi:predicted Zn-dependent peptidase
LQPKELIAKIQKVEAAEIKNIAKTIFDNTKLNMAVIGPYKKESLFKNIVKI